MTPSGSPKVRRTRLIRWTEVWDRGVTLTSRLQTFETAMLAEGENLAGLARISRELIGKGRSTGLHATVVLNMDSPDGGRLFKQARYYLAAGRAISP
jgi:hypothetical protein